MGAITKIPIGDRQVVLLMFFLSLAMHAGAFFTFRVTDKVRITGLAERPRVQWMRPQSLERPGEMALQYVIADTLDPSLMSLPSVRGFSRQMWERGIGATHRAMDWAVEPAFLNTKAPTQFRPLLNQPTLLELVQSSVAKGFAISEEPDGETLETPVVINRSVIRVAGGLEGRTVIRVPALPTVTSQAALRPTRVRVGVGMDGVVLYVSLERSCGNDAVDAQALQLARQIRFDPAATSALQSPAWGVVRFLWATQLPATAPASAPPEGAKP